MAKKKKKEKSQKGMGVKELRKRYKLLSELVDHIPDVVYVKDRQGKLLFVNRAHAKGVGLAAEKVVGKTDYDLFPKRRADKMTEDDQHVMKSGKPMVDKLERGTRVDGVDNYVSTTKVPHCDVSGKVIGLMGVTRDITRRMQLEKIKKDKEKIEKKVALLEDLNKMKSEFVAVVSHDLRIPLTVIKEAIMIILDELAGPVSGKQKDLLNKARKRVDYLSDFIGELLELAQAESNKIKLTYSLIDCRDLIMEVAESCRQSAKQKGIELDYHLPKKQLNIFLDVSKISRVLTNLLENAIKYTEHSGQVRLEAKVLRGKLKITVNDNGVGIAPVDLNRIFDKMVQLTRKTAVAKKGVGLGLSIVKELVERHGGQVGVESKIGVGSKFHFTLPGLYPLDFLDEATRFNINDFLAKSKKVHFYDFLFVSYDELKKKLKVKPGKLVSDLKKIIDATIIDSPGKSHLVLTDAHKGLCSTIISEAEDKDIQGIMKSLKAQLTRYFREVTGERFFIHPGTALYPQRSKKLPLREVSSNLSLKRMHIGQEQRRHQRFRFKTELEVLFPDKTTGLFRTVNISRGGLCFEVEKGLVPGSRTEIKLLLPGQSRSLNLSTRVAWVKDYEHSHDDVPRKYRAGLEFLDLQKKEETRLAGLIREVAAKKK